MATKREDDRWGKRPPSTRCFYIIIALLICIIIAFIILAVHFSKRKSSQPICNTRECLQSAYDTLFLMDPYKDPCHDFYQFACGDFETYNSLPVGMDIWTSRDENRNNIKKTLKDELSKMAAGNDDLIIRKVKQTYKSCMTTANTDPESITTLSKIMEGYGFPKWTDSMSVWREISFDRETMLSSLLTHWVPALVSLDIVPSGDHHALLISPGRLSSQPNASLTNPHAEKAYERLMTKLMNKLKVPEPVEDEVRVLMAIEKDLANMARTSCPTKQDPQTIREESLAQLDQAFRSVKWTDLMAKVLDELGINQRAGDIKVKVECRSYLQSLNDYLNSNSKSVSRYLSWRFALAMIPYMDASMRHLGEVFQLQVNPPSVEGAEIPSVADSCVEHVNRWLPEAVTMMYLQQEMANGTTDRVKEILKDVKTSFLKVLPKQDWLDKDSISMLEDKVKKMEALLARPPDFREVQAEYSRLTVNPESFLETSLTLMKHETNKKIGNLFQSKPTPTWGFSPLDMQSSTDHYRNTMRIPAGLMEEPFFMFHRPEYLNFGGIGFLLAQELFHGFNTKGMMFDARGAHKLALTNSSMDKFNDKTARCLVDSYSKFKLDPSDSDSLDGRRTLDTNIADNSAFYHTYQAYLEYEKNKGKENVVPGLNYTNHQLVFVQIAQTNCQIFNYRGSQILMSNEHGPSRFRTNGMAINSEEFSKEFKCSSGTPMNPEKKCRVWA